MNAHPPDLELSLMTSDGGLCDCGGRLRTVWCAAFYGERGVQCVTRHGDCDCYRPVGPSPARIRFGDLESVLRQQIPPAPTAPFEPLQTVLTGVRVPGVYSLDVLVAVDGAWRRPVRRDLSGDLLAGATITEAAIAAVRDGDRLTPATYARHLSEYVSQLISLESLEPSEGADRG